MTNIKTIEDQGEKQIKEIKDQGYVKTIKKYDYDDKDIPLISEQEKIFNELANKRLNKITELDKKINRDNLVYKYKIKSPFEEFDKYDNARDLIDKTKNGEIKLSEAKNDQKNFKLSLGEIKRGNSKKNQESKKTLQTILKCFTKQEMRLLNFMMITL